MSNKNIKEATLSGSLEEVRMDREGEYIVKFHFPHSEQNNIKIVESFVDKTIILNVKPEKEDKGVIIGED